MNPHSAAATGSGELSSPLGASSKIGLWWFLASEIILFGGLIGSYILFRLGNPAWAGASGELSVPIGTVNTFILLTSSLTLAMALAAAERDHRGAARGLLLATIVLGLGFLVIKGFEWGAKISHGIVPATNGFWSFYYGMTGLHALHVLAGCVINGVLMILAVVGRRRLPVNRLEAAGLYWHFVDVVWIFLFPLLYLA